MAGRIERVVPGAAAEAALAAEIRRLQVDDPLAPVWVVVREPVVGLSLRRRLAAEGAFAAVRFGSLGSLVQQLGAADSTGQRQPLTAVALRAAARVALGEQPGVLAPVAAHPATEASLAATYGDLRRATDVELDGLADAGGRVADVVVLVRTMRRLLAADYYDRPELIAAAIARLDGSAGAGAELDELGSVVVYLPDPLDAEERGLLASLSRRLEVLVLAGCTGDELADRAADAFVAEIRQSFGDPPATALGPEVADRSEVRFHGLLSAPDEDVEVREAVRRLLTHAEAGGDLGRCIVTFPDGGRAPELARRLGEQLRAAGLPSSGGNRRQLRDTPEAQLLIGLLELAQPVAPGLELDRGEVVGWLCRGPLRAGQGLTGALATVEQEGAVPVGAWDRCSRRAGVLSGIGQWRDRLARQIAHLEAGSESDRARARAGADLLEFIERLHALTSAATSATSWSALSRWAGEALRQILEPTGLRAELAEALGDLELLDGLDPLGQLPPAERLRRCAVALEVALARPAGERGRFGVGPTVGPLSAVAGASSDLLIVLGCREGDLPGRQGDDPLVWRAERDQIGAFRQAEGAEEAARRHLLWLMSASASPQASFARIDVRAGRLVYPSRWTGELFSGRLTEVPSFAGSIRRVTEGDVTAADVTDFELASLPDGVARRSPTWLDVLDTDYGRRRTAGFRQREGGLSPFAGYVPATGSEPGAWSAPLSPTGLQDFATCPFRFFVGHKLGVRRLEAPERVLMIDARDRGTLMHDVLEGFFGPVEGVERITVFDDEGREQLRLLAEAEFERFERRGKTGKAVFWATERARILRDLERYAARDLADSVAARRVPAYVELEFGGEDHPVVADVAGRTVRFRGRIDRVDRTADGRVVVVDYKSGKSESYRTIQEDPLGRGRHLQLPIYARAAATVLGPESTRGGPVRAEYRFLQATAGYEVIPVELTDEVAVQLDEVLGTLVSTIDAGCFPPRPGAPEYGFQYANCKYCDYDALCTTDRTDLWQSAGTDNEMKAFAELVTGPNE